MCQQSINFLSFRKKLMKSAIIRPYFLTLNILDNYWSCWRGGLQDEKFVE